MMKSPRSDGLSINRAVGSQIDQSTNLPLSRRFLVATAGSGEKYRCPKNPEGPFVSLLYEAYLSFERGIQHGSGECPVDRGVQC